MSNTYLNTVVTFCSWPGTRLKASLSLTHTNYLLWCDPFECKWENDIQNDLIMRSSYLPPLQAHKHAHTLLVRYFLSRPLLPFFSSLTYDDMRCKKTCIHLSRIMSGHDFLLSITPVCSCHVDLGLVLFDGGSSWKKILKTILTALSMTSQHLIN